MSVWVCGCVCVGVGVCVLKVGGREEEIECGLDV